MVLWFLFLLQNIDFGYSLEPPCQGGSNEYPQRLCFEQKLEKYQLFSTENKLFLLKIFSFYSYKSFFFFFFFRNDLLAPESAASLVPVFSTTIRIAVGLTRFWTDKVGELTALGLHCVETHSGLWNNYCA